MYYTKIHTIFFTTIIVPLLLTLSIQIVKAQEDSLENTPTFDHLEELFNDIETEQETQEQNTNDFIVPPSTLNISGEHTMLLPMPVNPEYLDFKESPRSPNQRNTLDLQYSTKNVNVHISAMLDYIAHTDNMYLQKGLSPLTIGESYVTLYNDYLSTSFGFKKYAWGSGLQFAPTDHLNPKSYTYSFLEEKIAVPSISLTYYPIRELSFETVFIPMYYSYVFPQNLVHLLQQTLKNHGMYIPFEQPNKLYQFQIGEKISIYTPIADISLSYLYDIDDNYSIDDTVIQPKIQFNFVRRNIHRLGIDIISTLDTFEWWAELALHLANEKEASQYTTIRNHSLQWIIGGDIRFGDDDDVTLILQHMGSYIFEYPNKSRNTQKNINTQKLELRQETLTYALGQQNEGLRLGFMADLTFRPITNMLSIALRGVYFIPLWYKNADTITRYGGIMALPVIEFTPIDNLSINIGSEISYAWQQKKDSALQLDNNDPLGRNARNNKVYIELHYKWHNNIQ